MEFFKQKTKINFLGIRKWTALISVILFAASIASLIVNGLNFGLQFTGGMQAQIHYNQAANLPSIRNELDKAGFKNAVVQAYGSSQDVLIRLPAKGLSREKLGDKLINALPGAKLRRVEYIGPQVGKRLATNGALALMLAIIATMIYIAMRFEYRFAISSTVALIHDPMLILGVFSFLHLEFDLNTLAALLAVLGYSLNDTIVVFDRVRENFRKLRKAAPVEVVNISVNQTLSRTIMTSALTLVSAVVLYFVGGRMIQNFALAWIIGIVVGTYSSIYVAGSLAVALGLSKKDMLPAPKKEVDDLP